MLYISIFKTNLLLLCFTFEGSYHYLPFTAMVRFLNIVAYSNFNRWDNNNGLPLQAYAWVPKTEDT